MTDIPGMILWTDAYFGDTHHLSTFEHGAYLLILMAMWRNGGKLANCSKNLAMLAHCRPEKWKRIEKKIMDFMTIVEGSDGKEITQKRLWQEYQLAKSRALSRSSAGRLGGLSKAINSLKNQRPESSNATASTDNFNSNSNFNTTFGGSARAREARRNGEISGFRRPSMRDAIIEADRRVAESTEKYLKLKNAIEKRKEEDKKNAT